MKLLNSNTYRCEWISIVISMFVDGTHKNGGKIVTTLSSHVIRIILSIRFRTNYQKYNLPSVCARVGQLHHIDFCMLDVCSLMKMDYN